MNLLDRFRRQARIAGWKAIGLGVLTVAELLLLLGAFVPLMQATTAIDADQVANLTYLWWRGTASRPGVFVLVSFVGGALGGALHGIASLTHHVARGDFDSRWTMWYLANPVIGAALATVFLFVLQAGLGGQAATTTGGLYGIAATATLTGLFSRPALDKLKEIFNVAFAPSGAAGTSATDRSATRTAGTGARGEVTQGGPE